MPILTPSDSIVIATQWPQFLSSVTLKSLKIQYVEDSSVYDIFAFDERILYKVLIYKGTVPNGAGVTQVDNDTYKTTFETVYQSTANQRSASIALALNNGIDIGDVTINNGAGVQAVNVQDGGNSLTVDGTVSISGIAGTVSLPTGASTEASLAKLTLGQSSTTATQTGPLVQGAVSATNPVYVAAQTNPISLDTSGGVRVHVIANDVATGGTSSTDSAAYLAGVTPGVPIMGANDDTLPTSVVENQVGIIRMSTRREMFTQIRDAAGNERGANVDASGRLSVIANQSGAWDIGTITNVVHVDDNGGSLSIDGTVSANQSGTWATRAQDGYGKPLTGLASDPVGSEVAMVVRNIPSGIQKISEGDELYLLTGALAPGNITLNDATNWNAARVYIRDISVNTVSTNYNISICQDNGFDSTSPTTREVIANGSGNTVIPVNMFNASATSSLFLKYTDNSGSATAKFFITGVKK